MCIRVCVKENSSLEKGSCKRLERGQQQKGSTDTEQMCKDYDGKNQRSLCLSGNDIFAGKEGFEREI